MQPAPANVDEQDPERSLGDGSCDGRFHSLLDIQRKRFRSLGDAEGFADHANLDLRGIKTIEVVDNQHLDASLFQLLQDAGRSGHWCGQYQGGRELEDRFSVEPSGETEVGQLFRRWRIDGAGVAGDQEFLGAQRIHNLGQVAEQRDQPSPLSYRPFFHHLLTLLLLGR